MAAVTVKIRIQGSQALRELAGVEKGLERAGTAHRRLLRQQIENATKAADAAKHSATSQQRTSDQLISHEQRNIEKLRVARERAERSATRDAKREAQKREKAEEKSLRVREKAFRDSWRRMGGFFNKTALGAGTAAMSAANQARGIAGVSDVATRVQNANIFKQGLVTTAVDAGLSKEQTDALETRITSAAAKSGTDPLEVLEGLQSAHGRFNMLREFAENIDAIALAAKANNTPLLDYVGAIGSAASAYGLQAGQFREAMLIMSGAASEGAIEMKDFSSEMAAAMGSHALNTGQRDIEGLRQLVGTMQTIGAGQFGAAETETRGTQAIAFLNKAQVAEDLADIGVKVRGADGKIDIGSVIDQLATNKHFQTPMQRQEIFHDMQAREGIETLIAQRNKVLAGEAGAVDFRSMRAVDASVGEKGDAAKITRLEDSGLLEMQRAAVDMQNDTITNLKSYNDQIIAVAKASNELEKSFGSLGVWASSLSLGGLVGLSPSILGKLLKSAEIAEVGAGAAGAGVEVGAGAGAGAAGASILATLGGTVSAASLSAILGTVGVGLGGGAIIGTAINAVTEDLTGKSASDRLANLILKGKGHDFDRQSTKRGLEALQGEIKLSITHEDNRTTIKQTSVVKNPGVKILPAMGPTMKDVF